MIVVNFTLIRKPQKVWEWAFSSIPELSDWMECFRGFVQLTDIREVPDPIETPTERDGSFSVDIAMANARESGSGDRIGQALFAGSDLPPRDDGIADTNVIPLPR